LDAARWRPADRPILTTPCILRPMTPDWNSRREEIRATLNRLRSSPDESVPLRVAAASHPLNDYGVKPHQHQRLGVDDATMRCLVLDDKGPRRTTLEVLAEGPTTPQIGRARRKEHVRCPSPGPCSSHRPYRTSRDSETGTTVPDRDVERTPGRPGPRKFEVCRVHGRKSPRLHGSFFLDPSA
jgi:hypothetical protein